MSVIYKSGISKYVSVSITLNVYKFLISTLKRNAKTWRMMPIIEL